MQRILRVNPRTVAQPTTWRAGLGELSPRLFTPWASIKNRTVTLIN